MTGCYVLDLYVGISICTTLHACKASALFLKGILDIDFIHVMSMEPHRVVYFLYLHTCQLVSVREGVTSGLAPVTRE